MTVLMDLWNLALATYFPQRDFDVTTDHFGLKKSDSPLIGIFMVFPHAIPSHMLA